MYSLLGEIKLFAFGHAPHLWLPCDGRTLSVRQNPALFGILGNKHGGDGKADFALPKLPPLGPKGPHYCICVSGYVGDESEREQGFYGNGDPPAWVGQVQLFARDAAPQGWLRCDGQTISISDHMPLFSACGSPYGGDGKKNFAVPKLPSLGPKGPHYYICDNGAYPLRDS